MEEGDKGGERVAGLGVLRIIMRGRRIYSKCELVHQYSFFFLFTWMDHGLVDIGERK